MIELKAVNYSSGSTYILKDINLQLHRGEFASIIGPNGAGKSTLLKIILGLIRCSSGSIRIDSQPQQHWLKKNFIGYMPQHENFDPNFPATALDIVLMGLAGKKGLFRWFSREDNLAACRIMEKVKILNQKNNRIGNLSGGELQRVYLARALLCDPDYIFLDEPDANVDSNGIVSFYNLLQELHKEGKTILMVSHDIHNTTRYCSQIICLNKTLHCHMKSELVNSEIIKKTFGEVIRIIERK